MLFIGQLTISTGPWLLCRKVSQITSGDRVIACHVHAAGMQLPSDFVGPGDEEPRAAVVGEAEGTAAAQHFAGPRGVGVGGKERKGEDQVFCIRNGGSHGVFMVI